jgi:UDP-N-acetylglucosamine 1-carboxyvinyltransferase
VNGHHAVVAGPRALSGTIVEAPDLRGGAALVIAGLVAEGTTEVRGIHHVDRGYEAVEQKLGALGACVERMDGRAHGEVRYTDRTSHPERSL